MSAIFLKILNMSAAASWVAAAVLPEKSAEMGERAALGLCGRAAAAPILH